MDAAKLKKELGLLDVFALCTGAMFSSGFFLLPGIAAADAGPSVVLAYLLAGVLVLPAMLSVAELSTAMPRAGGAYYFLDRALGPAFGAIDGVGSWLALVLKSAFALVGIGAYLSLIVELPIRLVAVGLVVVFAIFNVVGAKETASLQRRLVWLLLATIGIWMLAPLIVTVLFERGEFTAEDSAMTAWALRAYCFGLLGVASVRVLAAVFYAMERPRIPVAPRS